MRVISVAYAFAPVTRDSVGGAEQVLAHIDRVLGTNSAVVACAGSRPCGTLYETFSPPAAIPDGRAPYYDAVRAALARACAAWPDALVHLHGLDFAEVLPPPGPPVLVTLHLPLDWYAELRVARPRTWLAGVSDAQHATRGDATLLPPISNGVDLHAMRPGDPSHGAYVVLGRICPEKGQHVALRAAHLADADCVVAGTVFGYAAHGAYFARDVSPWLDSRRRYVGAVAGDAKRALLAGARAVLAPSFADETSSLVAMEAAACGTPVIAFARGALAETVVDGITGVIVREATAEALAHALAAADAIDRVACRAEAERRFDARRMAAAYRARYAELSRW